MSVAISLLSDLLLNLTLEGVSRESSLFMKLYAFQISFHTFWGYLYQSFIVQIRALLNVKSDILKLHEDDRYKLGLSRGNQNTCPIPYSFSLVISFKPHLISSDSSNLSHSFLSWVIATAFLLLGILFLQIIIQKEVFWYLCLSLKSPFKMVSTASLS